MFATTPAADAVPIVRLRDIVAFLAVAFAWGLTFAAVEVGLRSFPPLLLMAARYDVAAVLLMGYVVVSAGAWRPTVRGDVMAIAGGGIFWIAVGNGVWYVGQGLTSSVLSGLMTSLIPIATTVISWVLLPEDRLSAASLFGVAVSFVGAVLVVWPTDATTFSSDILGTGLLLVGVLGSALGSVLLRRASTSVSNTALTAWSVLVGAGVIHILSYAVGERIQAAMTLDSLAALVYLGVVATGLAYLLYFSLLGRYSAIEVTLVTYLVPVVALIAGTVLLDEHITPRMLAGFVVILVGFVILKQDTIRGRLRDVGTVSSD